MNPATKTSEPANNTPVNNHLPGHNKALGNHMKHLSRVCCTQRPACDLWMKHHGGQQHGA